MVFDLPNALVSTVEQYWKDGYMTLTECTQLPELQDRPSDYYQRLRNNDRGESWLWGLGWVVGRRGVRVGCGEGESGL